MTTVMIMATMATPISGGMKNSGVVASIAAILEYPVLLGSA